MTMLPVSEFFLEPYQHFCLRSVPLVTIIFEGGKKTIENVYYDLRENIPVVIINVSTSKRRLV